MGCVLFLTSLLRSSGLQSRDLVLVCKRIARWPAAKPILWAVVGSVDYACFAWATRFLDIAVVVVVFEMYPAGIMLLIGWLFRRDGRHRSVTVVTVLMVGVSMVGLVLANASQVADFGSVGAAFLWRSFIGVGLVAVAMVAAALSVYGLRWGADMGAELRPANRVVELYCVIVALLVVGLVGVLLSAVIGVVAGESMSSVSAAVAFGGGLVVNAVASITWRKAAVESNTVGVNAVGFAVPVLSLWWLHWIANAEVFRWGLLIGGAAAIVVANTVINFEPEIRASLGRSARCGRPL